MPAATPKPTTHTAPHRRWRTSSIALILSAWAILQLGGLFTPGLLDDVDSIYIQIAREMLQRHNYVTPTIDGIRFFDKPPLMYWMAAGSMHLFGSHFGIQDWAARLPLALGVLALLLAVYALGIRFYSTTSSSANSDRAGLYAALAMATCIGPYLYTRFYIPDILIALWMTLSVHLFLIALERVNHNAALKHPDQQALISTEAQRSGETPAFPRPAHNAVISTEAQRSGETPVFPRPAHNAVISTGAQSAEWRDLQVIAPQPSALLPCLAFAAITALNLLTKGFIGIVFPLGFVLLYLAFTRQLRLLKKLHLIPSTLVFLIIAAPWHILAAIRNPPIAMPAGVGLPAHAGWAWFYLYNEHIARFLGRRIPHDYGQVPIPIFWALLLLWLFPWVAFLPAALMDAYRTLRHRNPDANISPAPDLGAPGPDSRTWVGTISEPRHVPASSRQETVISTGAPSAERRDLQVGAPQVPRGFSLGSHTPAQKGALAPEVCPPQLAHSRHREAALSNLLWAGIILGFFTLSSRQEYYHLPALPALALLVGGFLADADARLTHRINAARAAIKSAAYGLVPIATLLFLLCGYFALTAPTPHLGTTLNDVLSTNPADYNLSLGHIFDLTGRAMGFFRGPLLTVALCMLALGPIAYLVRRPAAKAANGSNRSFAANLLIAAAMLGTLTAAHTGLVRFYPILGSKNLAQAIDAQYHPGDLIIIDGELTSGSTLLFYTPRTAAPVLLVNGRINGPWFGSFYPDAPHIFLNDQQLAHLWAGPHRIFLLTHNPKSRTTDLTPDAPVQTFATSGGKTILTNR
ncbi:MAG: glycosyltransferase family 39 protein [Acidobacteriaceae bacterium]